MKRFQSKSIKRLKCNVFRLKENFVYYLLYGTEGRALLDEILFFLSLVELFLYNFNYFNIFDLKNAK